MNNATLPLSSYQYTNGSIIETTVSIISEISVTLTVNGQLWLSFMCSPKELEELVIGYLFNENIITHSSEIEILKVCDNFTNIDVWLTHKATPPSRWRRGSGCENSTGRTNEKSSNIPVGKTLFLYPDDLIGMIRNLYETQKTQRETSGNHCSALFCGSDLVYFVEDIGRHNTIDKLVGKLIKNNDFIDKKAIITTGRISSEMLQKMYLIDTEMVISRTTPTTSAVESAQKLGITLIGYLRGNSFYIFSHKDRIMTTPGGI